ncbi:uroporphyrinogen-III C-methyltransferase [Sinomicrobium weinanense]|uniref:uroporphyrinogen-III C-methyltransferase n=1 Tax=Sinomicrobium weinanense TaxID=2842200 RepID=A0A926JQC4_9FLAO|nr:uroporphyrinogen-III C-methyltransferase [Sinomicrobium weinanense]MBC9795525.1 uroporphyrinogen-III C-methyltransferase [Sinomicrobium weinanense]MBU3123328.1 uroporphyrinogen-III C-methyltransferase [Sinomicrobium weinanense]
MKKQPKLTLIGAGPGDPELITLKAVKALALADVVLYDALVDPELLSHAPQAEKVFVGKRKGAHQFSQEEINRLIVDKALNNGHVVRLKGGDPNVFGRGAEEVEYAENFGVMTSIIPGIISAIAVPAGQGIPVTRRRVAESFWVVTGTTSAGALSGDIRLAAQSTATVIILMGMGKLREIVSVYRECGKNDLPVAVIQNGTTMTERAGYGTIDTIEEVVRKEGLSSPAVIVTGEVVKYASALAGYYEEEFLEDEFLFQNLNLLPFLKRG